MKKRVKLLTTIASLCLAVALMAFGVYAATNISFSATSQVAFATSDIMGSWYLGAKLGEEALNITVGETTEKAKMLVVASDVDDLAGVEGAASVAPVTYTKTPDAQIITYTVEFYNQAEENGAMVDLSATLTNFTAVDDADDYEVALTYYVEEYQTVGTTPEATAAESDGTVAAKVASVNDVEVGHGEVLVVTITFTYTCSNFAKATSDTLTIAGSAVPVTQGN